MTASHLWVVLLAAGEGSHFGDFSIRTLGSVMPKQLWSLDGSGGMLDWALSRAARIVPRERILAISLAEHTRWVATHLREIPDDNVIFQPADRGTAPGILLAVRKVHQIDPKAVVALLPSDHHVDDEWALAAAILSASRLAKSRPDLVVLCGALPGPPTAECSWIVSRKSSVGDGLREVACLVERREADPLNRLSRRGALVNTGITIATSSGLLALFGATVPDLVKACERSMVESADDTESMGRLYAAIAPRDFTREVLAKASTSLAVTELPPCGWTDLGTPAALRGFLRDRVVSSPAVVRTGASDGASHRPPFRPLVFAGPWS